MNEEAKKLLTDAKNICLIPSQHEPESLAATLALFYTLKELGKNVNLIVEEFPEKLNFLVPSLDFISGPKNFVISVPRNMADVSQIYYEKNEESLKIHLTVEKGHLKKESVAFYFQEPKPDVVVTLGIHDMQSQLAQMDSFGFLMASPIINLDNSTENRKFGRVNIIENKSLSELVRPFTVSADQNTIKKNTANCLLAGLMIYYENFKSSKTTPEAFQLSGELIKKGADHQQVIENIYKATEKEVNFLANIFQNLRSIDNAISVAMLPSQDFQHFAEAETMLAVEKMRMMGIQNDLLVLWPSHASDYMVKGFLYSKKPDLLDKISKNHKEHWAFISMPGSDIDAVKEKILSQLHVLQYNFA